MGLEEHSRPPTLQAIAQSSPAHGHAFHVVTPVASASAAEEHTPAPSVHAQTPLTQSASSPTGLSESRESLQILTKGHPHQLTDGHPHEFLRELSQTPVPGHPHEFFALPFAEAGSPTRPRPSPRVRRRSSLFTEDAQPEEGSPFTSGMKQMLPATAESAEPLSTGAFEREEEGSSQESVSQVEDSERA